MDTAKAGSSSALEGKENRFKKISSSPHVRSEDSTAGIMLDVLIGLLPASIMGVYNFGVSAFVLILVCIAGCVASEWAFEFFTKRKLTIGDFSAVVTGLLLALNLPPTLPWWQALLGSVFAIIIVKQLFGGIGQNFMNPALGARCFLLLSFAQSMTHFTYDAVTTATPLALMKAGESVDVFRMFIGSTAGTIGETSTAAILIGAAYLLIKRIIDIRIPAAYLGTFSICIMIYALASGRGFDLMFLAAHLCGGGLMLGAVFMATDYVTSPVTPLGRLIYGGLIGILTFVLRSPWNPATSAEGVSYSIIIANLLVPIIERFTMPRSFGRGAVKHE